MFTIDLLKGEGVPVKSGPKDMAIISAAISVPVIIAMVMLGVYLRNRVVIAIQQQQIVNYETKIEKFSDVVEMQKAFEMKKEHVNNCLSEVSSALGGHIQWSPILAELVENMPESMIFTNLDVRNHVVKKMVPQKGGAGKKVEKSFPIKILRMRISGAPRSNYDREVRDFRDRLRFSTLFAPKLEDIRVSQEIDMLGGQEVVSYDIDCVFKPSL